MVSTRLLPLLVLLRLQEQGIMNPADLLWAFLSQKPSPSKKSLTASPSGPIPSSPENPLTPSGTSTLRVSGGD
jgi:hypothetical protein